LVRTFAQARGNILAGIVQQRTAVQQSLVARKNAVRETVEGQAQRLHTEGLRLGRSVTEAAQTKTAAAHELGEAQARRAQADVARQAAQARQRGAAKAATFRDSDQERAQTQQNAVLEVAEEQAREIEKTAPEIARGAREQADNISTNYIARGNEVAAQIQSTVPETQTAVRGLIAIAHEQLDQGAHNTLSALAQIEQGSIAQLGNLEAASLAQVRRMPVEVLPQIEAMKQAAVDQVDHGSEETHTQLEIATAETVAGLARHQANLPQVRPVHAAGIAKHDAISGRSMTALRRIERGFDTQVMDVSGQALAGLARVQGQVGGAVAKTTQGTLGGASSLSARSSQGQELVLAQAAGRATQLVDQGVARFTESATRTIAEFNGSFERGQSTVIGGVTGSLAKNDELLAQMDANMTAAAAKAAEEYDRPAWKKALLAFGKAILYLAAGLLILFVLAALIFVGAWLLAAAGLITAISFATALTIAVVVLAVVAVGYEFVKRLQAYKAEHGPVDSFWKALGISAALLGLSILNLVGVTSIIEGFMGHRFFSDVPLSSQEKYDLVIGGFVQLITVIFGFTKTGKAIFGKLGDFIGKFVESLLPKGIRPPTPVDPPVDPIPVVPKRPRVFGGDTDDFEVLYHYTARDNGGQNPGSDWTTWETTDVKSASRMTGVPENLITIRRSVRVNRDAIAFNRGDKGKLFRDFGSKNVPGEGGAIEYRNNVPVPPEFIETVPMKSPQ
jgi:hypothetical protein